MLGNLGLGGGRGVILKWTSKRMGSREQSGSIWVTTVTNSGLSRKRKWLHEKSYLLNICAPTLNETGRKQFIVGKDLEGRSWLTLQGIDRHLLEKIIKNLCQDSQETFFMELDSLPCS